MRQRHWFKVLAMAALASAMSAPVFAEHGKAGEWDITVKNEFPGMPKIPTVDRERMEREGIPVPDMRTKHANHCMTAEEVASTDLPKLNDRNKCTMSNPRIQGQTFSADLSCTGQVRGEGGISVTYDKPEHYSGIARIQGSFFGQPVDMLTKFEGTWTSPTCDKGD